MSDILFPIICEIGLGGVIGFVVGFSIKKLSKFVLFLIGMFIAVLIYLNSRGVLNVNYGALFKLIGDFLGMASSALNWLIHIIALLPFAVSFTIGFVVGFKLR